LPDGKFYRAKNTITQDNSHQVDCTRSRHVTDTSSPTSERADTGFPQPFNKFVLVHALGEGGMGAVYLTKTRGITGIEKLCVIKTLRPTLVANNDYAAHFLNEAHLVVQLAHRNICPVFDVGQIN